MLRMKLYSLLNWLKRYNLRSFNKQVIIAQSTRLLRGFSVRFLAKAEERRYLSIGQSCILNVQVIFEGRTGEVIIGDHCYIGAASSIISRERIELGNHVTIAWGVTLYDHNSHSLDPQDRRIAVNHFYEHYGQSSCFNLLEWNGVESSPIKISDHVWIGFDAVILKGVTIGEGAIVGARSVVTHDVEPYTVVAGNPALVVKRLNKLSKNN